MENKNFNYCIATKLGNEKLWKQIFLSEYKPTKPVVLNLPGLGADTFELAYRNTKPVQTMLGVLRDKVDILSVNYNCVSNHEDVFENVDTLVQHLFATRVIQDGKRISTEQACKNIRQITVFAHCYGAYEIMSDIEKCIRYQFEDLGYSPKEISQILSQIVCISHGTYSNLQSVTEINCVSSYDHLMGIHGNTFWNDVAQMAKKKRIFSMSKEDRKELLNSYKDAMHFPKNFLSQRQRCFAYSENSHKLCIAAAQLSKGGQDHGTKFLIRKSAENLATDAGDHINRIYTCVLREAVINSIKNTNNSNFIEFNFEKTKSNIDQILKEYNYGISKERI